MLVVNNTRNNQDCLLYINRICFDIWVIVEGKGTALFEGIVKRLPRCQALIKKTFIADNATPTNVVVQPGNDSTNRNGYGTWSPTWYQVSANNFYFDYRCLWCIAS